MVPTPTPTPKPPTPTPTPTPTPPGTPGAGQIVGTCTGWPNPHVEIRWSAQQPPGAQPPNTNSILRGIYPAGNTWFFGGGNPPPGVAGTRINGSYASPVGPNGYPQPNYAVHDLRDDSVSNGKGLTYNYYAQYRPETPSINSYTVTIDAASCAGASVPTVSPTPTPSSGDGRISGYCTWVNAGPVVHVSWSQNPPPGTGAANTNGLQKGDCYPGDPNQYWCFLSIGATQYSYDDATVLQDTQYQYRAKYQSGVSSINTFNIYTSGANCGLPAPTPGPLIISPTYQNVPPNVTALLAATGGDGSYYWSTPDGAQNGAGSSIGVTYTSTTTQSVIKTVTAQSGTQTATATVQVDGIQTFQDDITVIARGPRYVIINDDQAYASTSNVTLTLGHGFAGEATVSMTMKLGNTPEAAVAAIEQPFQKKLAWNLCTGLPSCDDGLYTVYAIYLTPSGTTSPAVSDSIVYLRDVLGMPAIAINGGEPQTASRTVLLTLHSGLGNVPFNQVTMQVANRADLVATAPEVPYSMTLDDWDLCGGLGSVCLNGSHTVYVRYCARGLCTLAVFDNILLDSPWPDWGVTINTNAPATTVKNVLLTLNPWFDKPGVNVFLSNTPDFTVLASSSFAPTVPWDLCGGLPDCIGGTHTVYVRYVDGSGTLGWPSVQSPRYQDDIDLQISPTPTPLPAGVLIDDGTATTTSRIAKLTFTSPFAGGDVSMRPLNEKELSARDIQIIKNLGGGIDSQPPVQRQIPSTSLVSGAAGDVIPNRTPSIPGVVADTIIPELDGGGVRKLVASLTGWDLCYGAVECPYGTYRVFVQYYRTPSVTTRNGTLAAIGDEVSGVYYDTIVYGSPTPTPTATPPVITPPVIPPSGGGGTGGGTGGGIGGALSGASSTIGLISMAASVAVILSALMALSGLGAGAFAFAWQWFQGVLGLLPARKKVWGTVYDSNTKRPIPFAKVQLMDRNKRVLETRIADKDGRYGFLTSPESLMAQNVQISILPGANGYLFPSHAPVTVDTFVYNNLYFGDLITVSDKTLINFDVPMDPVRPSATPLLLKSPSIALGASVAAIADAGFWLGVIMVPLNFILNPNPFTLGVLFLFFGTASLRIWGISEHPFGTVTDNQTGRAMPFALITLNDLTGKRIGFTVTDEQGRYFLVAERGTYEINVFTPAAIQPTRQARSTIEARKGWITRELKL